MNQEVPQPAMKSGDADARALSNLSVALEREGRLSEAEAALRQAAKLSPELYPIYANLGNVLRKLGKPLQALSAYQAAIQIEPRFADGYSLAGDVLCDLGRPSEALDWHDQALAIKPELARSLVGRGNALQMLGRLGDAEAAFRSAVAIHPALAVAHANLGTVLRPLGKVLEAENSYRRAIELQPANASIYTNLGALLQSQGRFEGAIDCLEKALSLAPEDLDAHSNLIFTLNSAPDTDPALALKQAKVYGDLVARRAISAPPRPARGGNRDVLRVGFVSGDFGDHPIGYFTHAVFEAFRDPSHRVQVIAYPTAPRFDAGAEAIRAACHSWRPAWGVLDADLAQMIRDDAIDVLVDLSGHTAHNRLSVFAHAPAPIQASWLGYIGTTGVGAIDAYITDQSAAAGQSANFTERLVALPNSFLCMTPPDAPGPQPIPALTAGHVTFGCFNNLSKVNDNVVAVWSKVLGATPGSRLLLVADALSDHGVQEQTLDRFAAQGIGGERLSLAGRMSRSDYLRAYNCVDIALDPFPYPGGTTTVEGLWMGVPVVTMEGERPISRTGVSIAHNAGLSDWIARDEADYVAIARRWAGDLTALSTLRVHLREQVAASPLFDAQGLARDLSAVLWGLWGASPRS